MAHYPNTPGFTGTLRPLRIEGDILDLEIEGEIPAQLAGTFHRVHPDAQFAPMDENDQFFNGDGYVIALIDNHVTNYSDLAIFDAQHVDEGPIARAKLPLRIRQGLHGNWADESKLAA
jgi:carotenoid cleavage dioxygenase-like enzyme